MGSTFRTNFAASGKIFAGRHRASESESAAKKTHDMLQSDDFLLTCCLCYTGAHAPPDRGGPVCGPGFLCGFRNPFWGPCEGPSFCVLPVFCAGWFWGFVSVKRLYLGCSIVLWVSH